MSFLFILLLFFLGFIGSFLSGMLGVGGAIINYPLILFIPPLFGLPSFSAHEVSGIVAVQVFFATLSGVLAYRKGGYLNKTIILVMGSSVLTGSLVGGFGSRYLTENMVNVIYGVLALIAVILMFLPKRSGKNEEEASFRYNKPLAAVLSFLVGLSAGIVGAGGAFLLVPIMISVLGIPIRVTVATSLAVTFIASIGTVSGKLFSHQIAFLPSLIVIIASLVASPLGAKLGQKLKPSLLKWIFAGLVVMVAIKIWSQIFNIKLYGVMSMPNWLFYIVIIAVVLWLVLRRFGGVKGVQTITASELKNQLKDKNKQFIDVRTPGEYKSRHIREFKNIPLHQLPQKVNQLSKDKEVVVICQSGMRSARACKILKQNGFEKVTNVKGSMNAW